MARRFREDRMRNVNNRILTFRGIDAAAVLFGLGRYPTALSYVNRILKKEPANVEALLLRATLLSYLGHHRSAHAIVNGILATDPGNFDALLEKASLSVRAGRYKRASEIFSLVARRQDITRGERRYLYWQWINALLASRRWCTARRVLNEALRRFPKDDLLNHYKTELPTSPVRY
jgi:tetratricopeptide (TPR) repeat protein